MKTTVERIYPFDKRVDKYTIENHKERYRFASEFFSETNNNALDLCCGTGYGAYMLWKAGYRVTAYDRNKKALLYAVSHYPDYVLDYNRFYLKDIRDWKPFEQYKLITFFEALEHFSYKDGEKILKKIKKCLGIDGVALISVPIDSHLDTNTYHKVEYSLDKFREILESIFDKVEILGQNAVTSKISKELRGQTYYIAICQ